MDLVVLGDKRPRMDDSISHLDRLENQGVRKEEVSRSMRQLPPAHYLLKIDAYSFLSNTAEKYASDVFDAEGYKWRLSFHPNGDKKKNVENYISLYLVIAEVDTLPPCWGVNVNFKLFVYDQIKDRYLTVQDADGAVKRFYAMKTEWGFEKLLSLESFKDPANGYLVNDSCVFGMEVFVIRDTGNWESVSLLNPPLMTNPTFRWEIKEFSKLDQESYQSQAFAVGGIDWVVTLCPKGFHSQKNKSLSVYVRPSTHAFPNKAAFYVVSRVRVLDEVNGKHAERAVGGWYDFTTANSFAHYADFMSLEDLHKSSNAYILRDTLILEFDILIGSQTKVFHKKQSKPTCPMFQFDHKKVLSHQ